MVGLLQLPNELLAIIFDGLDAQGFSVLRLASRHVNQATLPAFTSRYFETRYVMLSTLSLENLVEIAQHQFFGPALETLELCLDRFEEFPAFNDRPASHIGDMIQARREGRAQPMAVIQNEGSARLDSEGDNQPPLAEEERVIMNEEPTVNKDAYQSLWEEQSLLLQSGLAQAYLTRALATLTNVKTIAIDNAHRPWGAKALTKLTNWPPTNSLDDFEEVPFLSQLLRTTITAIVTSSVSLRTLAITPGIYQEGFTPSVLRLAPPHLRYYRSLPSTLQELELNLSPDHEKGNVSSWSDDKLMFISNFQHLTQLTLDINQFAFGSLINRLGQIASKLHLPNLQSLVLCDIYCSVMDLGMLLRNYRATLQSIDLVHVTLSGGINHWGSLFILVRDHLSTLEFSITKCFAGNFSLFCQVKTDDGYEFLDEFDIRSNEDRTRVIETMEARPI